MAHCPECEAVLDIDMEEVEEGQLVSCPDCGWSLRSSIRIQWSSIWRDDDVDDDGKTSEEDEEEIEDEEMDYEDEEDDDEGEEESDDGFDG